MAQNRFLPPNLTLKKIVNIYLSEKNKEELKENNWIKPLLKTPIYKLSYGQLRYFEILILVHLDV